MNSLARSSRGLGHHPLKVAARVRIPYGLRQQYVVRGTLRGSSVGFPDARVLQCQSRASARFGGIQCLRAAELRVGRTAGDDRERESRSWSWLARHYRLSGQRGLRAIRLLTLRLSKMPPFRPLISPLMLAGRLTVPCAQWPATRALCSRSGLPQDMPVGGVEPE